MENNNNNKLKLLLPQLASSVITHGIGHPLYTIKTRLQVGTHTKFVDCFYNTVKNEGIKTFYRGYPSLLLSAGLVRPIEMATFEILNKETNNPYLSGFIAGGITGTIGCPLSVTRTVMQSSTSKQHKNMLHGTKYIWDNFGIKGFFAGYPIQMAYYLTIGTLYLGTYGALRNHIFGDQEEYNFYKYALFSATMSTLMKLTLYPIDSVRSVAQNENISVKEAFCKIKQMKGFYRGAYPVLLYLIPIHSTAIMVYETTKQMLVNK